MSQLYLKIPILETIISTEKLRECRGFLHLYHIDVYILIKDLMPRAWGFFVGLLTAKNSQGTPRASADITALRVAAFRSF